MSLDEQWVKEWFEKLDRSSKFNAIADLRLSAERAVMDLNRDIGEQEKEFSKAILEIYSFLEVEEKPENLEERFQRAQELGEQLKVMGAQAVKLQKEYAAFAKLEQFVSRGGSTAPPPVPSH